MSFKLKEKAREYARNYYYANREKMIKYMSEYQKKNKKYDKKYSLRALKAWRTRNQQNKRATNSSEIRRLNKLITTFEKK